MLEQLREIVVLFFLVVGVLFLLLAAVGVVRMPDVFTRMQAATKAATLGAGCMLLAVAVYFDSFGVTMRALLVTAFLFITAPVAAHMLGRAAYFIGAPVWKKTHIDELRGKYDLETHCLIGSIEELHADDSLSHRVREAGNADGSSARLL